MTKMGLITASSITKRINALVCEMDLWADPIEDQTEAPIAIRIGISRGGQTMATIEISTHFEIQIKALSMDHKMDHKSVPKMVANVDLRAHETTMTTIHSEPNS